MSRMVTLAGLLALLAAPIAHAKGGDRDGDRLPDRWEQHHDVRSASADRDSDGLTNWAEYRSKTHPRRRDSDGDGRPDGREDRDRDGLVNRLEEPTGHDPAVRDSDGDGVRDGRENAGLVVKLSGGVLTLATGRKRLRGTVAETTAVGCGHGGEAGEDEVFEGEPVDGGADDAPGEDTGDEGEGDGEETPRHSPDVPFDGGEPAEDEPGDAGDAHGAEGAEDDALDAAGCTLSSLARGVYVHEADVTKVDGRLVFTRIELAGE